MVWGSQTARTFGVREERKNIWKDAKRAKIYRRNRDVRVNSFIYQDLLGSEKGRNVLKRAKRREKVIGRRNVMPGRPVTEMRRVNEWDVMEDGDEV